MKCQVSLIYLALLISLSQASSYVEDIDNVDIPIPPNYGLTIEGLCQKYNYPLETHYITTKDGYILGVHRIPHGIKKDLIQDEIRPPILMVHGILSSSTDWVNTGPNKSLALQLADKGYDIWLMNMRGNVWSKNHTKLNPVTDAEFWDFSFNEVGLYDIPATIDHVLKLTGADNLTYIGFSEGTTASIAMTSTNTTYNEKLNLVVALAPVAFMSAVEGPVLQFVKKYDFAIKIAVGLLNLTEIPQIGLLKDLGILLCNEESPILDLCTGLIFLFAGEDKEQFDNSFLPVFFSNFPNSGSVKSLLHYMQFINNEAFRMYDYGLFENRKRYGTITPPDYNLSLITAPVALYHGPNDFFSSSTDMDKLTKGLPNKVSSIAVDKFNHLDFLLAKDVNKLLNDQVIQLINKYNKKE